MADTATKAASRRPRIHLAESDYDMLAGLALRMERSRPELAELILDEIDRAHIHEDGKLPAGVVAVGSEVEFVDERDGTSRRVTLVLPSEADIEAGKVSITTPVGIGLIGLSTGQSIDWPCPDGRPRTLSILAVRSAG